jgi:sodium transport system permease protein
MNFKAVRVLFRKEALDLIRDRRTLISMVVAPMLIGPLIMAATNYYIRRSEQEARVERFKVGVRESTELAGLRPALQSAGLDVIRTDAPRAAVESKQVTFGVEVSGAVEKPVVVFYSDNSDMKASMARRRVDAALDGLAKERVRDALAKKGLAPDVLDPFQRQSVNVAQPRKMSAAFLGRLIGFLLLIFLFNGAMYAAVDTTAGEKERRTLEVLLSTSAGRTEIVTAKVLVALLTSVGTTVLSMASYAVALSVMQEPGMRGPAFVFPTDPLTLILLLVLIVPVAVVAASISVAAATPARSSREAMSYLTPGLFVVMTLGMIPMLGSQASAGIALMPFANFAQMLREVLAGEFHPLLYALTIGSNLVYSAIAIAFAVRVFRNEKVLFRS